LVIGLTENASERKEQTMQSENLEAESSFCIQLPSAMNQELRAKNHEPMLTLQLSGISLGVLARAIFPWEQKSGIRYWALGFSQPLIPKT
jgi:hypothetical protein